MLSALRASEARRVLDLGCGEGKLLRELLKDKQFAEIVGLDVSVRSLEIASRRLKLDRLPEQQAKRIRLVHGSLIYRDRRLEGFDAAAVVEVIEHLDPPRLSAFERSRVGGLSLMYLSPHWRSAVSATKRSSPFCVSRYS